jgi:hypothetical protein
MTYDDLLMFVGRFVLSSVAPAAFWFAAVPESILLNLYQT